MKNCTAPEPTKGAPNVARPRFHKRPLHSDSALIDRLGGTTAAAAFFEVRGPSVSSWRHKGIPRARMMYLRAMRPDLFETTEPIVRAEGTAQ